MKTFANLGLPLFLLASALLALLVSAAITHSTSDAATAPKSENQTMIKARIYNSKGELVGPISMPKWQLSEDEWKKRLAPEQFRILRTQGTERAFCGNLLDNKKLGTYSCAGCGLPLFSSDSKFNSGTGWPSFFQPICPENVVEKRDESHGMTRTEINCARCDGHLGHVFDDGPRPTGLRFCLNSESLQFTEKTQLAKLAEPLADAPASTQPAPNSQPTTQPAAADAQSSKTAAAVFAGGCFWCTEEAFQQLKGVSTVVSGYAGGPKALANYTAVCTGQTGHAEAIKITYDPRVITYDQLLMVFFDAHDPTTLNQQGADKGTQYRSAIFYASDSEKQAASAKIAALNASKAFRGPIVTTLEPLKEFFPAEDYHQDYAQKNPNQPYIKFTSMPKACKVRDRHPELLKDAQ